MILDDNITKSPPVNNDMFCALRAPESRLTVWGNLPGSNRFAASDGAIPSRHRSALVGGCLIFLAITAASCGELRPVISDRDFAGFPKATLGGFDWEVKASGAAKAEVVAEAPAGGPDKNSLHLLDPDLDAESFRPLVAAALLSSPASDPSVKAVVISFDFRMANTGTNSNLLFRVYDDAGKNTEYVGVIQFFNNWNGEGRGVLVGNKPGAELAALKFDQWYHVEVTLPPPGTEGTQSFLVKEPGNDEPVLQYSERMSAVLGDYTRLSFSSGFGDARQLDAMISNVSVATQH
ncbi:hypothetical protein DB345_09790 [Spartobacteria bacterium LR76]|nr:hypothetical protein DB345_09790 [Spartobacteria bacterium LR76]